MKLQKELEKLRAQDQREIKALKQELRRKEKAMAEMATLMVLRKKMEGVLLGKHGRLTRAMHRHNEIKLINEAHAAGKGLVSACSKIDICLHTFKRWT